MEWFINSALSNLIVIILLALANNLCFVAVAKVRKWRLERKDTINKLQAEVEHLEACNLKLHEKLNAYELAGQIEITNEQPSLVGKIYGEQVLNVANA